MKIITRLAGLKCPCCGDLLQPNKLAQTHTLALKKIESHECQNCAAKLRIEDHRYLLRIAICLIPAFLVLYLSDGVLGMLSNDFAFIETFEFLIKAGVLGVLMGSVIMPITARLVKVEHLK